MSKKLMIVTSIVLSSIFFPFVSNAEDDPSATPAPAPTSMQKKVWLKSMTPALPDLICKGFMQDADLKKQFDELKMTAEKCVSLIPESMAKCQKELYSKIPEQVSSEIANTWSKTLGECIGKDFAEQYLIPK